MAGPFCTRTSNSSNVFGWTGTAAPPRVRARRSVSSRNVPNSYNPLLVRDIALQIPFFQLSLLLLRRFKGPAHEPPPTVGSWHTHLFVQPDSPEVYARSRVRRRLARQSSALCSPPPTLTARVCPSPIRASCWHLTPPPLRSCSRPLTQRQYPAQARTIVMESLPAEGEIVALSASSRQKLPAVSPVLRAVQREGVYQIKVVDVPQAAIAIHARAVVLISGTALSLLDANELAAAVAHGRHHRVIVGSMGTCGAAGRQTAIEGNRAHL